MSIGLDSEAWTQFPLVRPAPRRVGYRDDETAISLLVRLMLANGNLEVRHLLKSTPHLRVNQVKNRESTVEIAARLSGFDVSGINAATPIVMQSSQLSVAGVVFNRLGTRPGRVCPLCVAHDLDIFATERIDLRAFRRGYWQVPSISTCPEHEVCMVSACGNCGQELEERRRIGTCRCGLGHMSEVAVGRDACQHDAWLLGRLGFAPRIEHPKLDTMPPHIAAELCRVLGSSAIDVKTGSGCNINYGLLAEVRSRGWRILLGGDAELEQTLDNIVNRNRLNSRVCSTSYGGLNHFLKLNTNRALDPVREQILAHARSNIGMGGKGARLFGRTVADGERLSLVQGANALAVSESLLANVLVALNPDFKMLAAGATLLDHGQLKNAKEALQATLRTSEAKAVLRFDDKLMKLAIRRGCLQCLIKPTPTNYGLVWRRDVTRISMLFDGGPVVATDGLLAPAPFAKLGGVTLAEILFQVIEGNLQAVGRRHDVPGFHGLLFEPGDAAVLWPVPRGTITRSRLLAALGWMRDTIPGASPTRAVAARKLPLGEDRRSNIFPLGVRLSA